MFDMRSVFHRAKTFSTVVTKQVSYQIFICIFRLRVTSPRMGIRLWGTEGRLCLPCHIHSEYEFNASAEQDKQLLFIFRFEFIFSNTLPSVLQERTCNLGGRPQIQGLKKLSIGEKSQCCKYEEFTNSCLFNCISWVYKFLRSVSSTSKTLINKHLNAIVPLC